MGFRVEAFGLPWGLEGLGLPEVLLQIGRFRSRVQGVDFRVCEGVSGIRNFYADKIRALGC